MTLIFDIASVLLYKHAWVPSITLRNRWDKIISFYSQGFIMKKFMHTRNGHAFVYIVSNCVTALYWIPMLSALSGNFWISLFGIFVGLLATTAIARGILVYHFPASRQAPPPAPDGPLEHRGFQTRLSRFARRRIPKGLPYVEMGPVLFEAKLSLVPLLFQFEPRERFKQPVRLWNKNKPDRWKLTPGSTLYGEVLVIATVIWLLTVMQGAAIQTRSLNWLIEGFVWVLLGALIAVVGALYRKWERLFFFRLVCFAADQEKGLPARLVLIDKPPVFAGGAVFWINVSDVRIAFTATSQEEHLEGGIRSSLAGRLDFLWIVIDSTAGKDTRFNWHGPYRHADQIVGLIIRERDNE